MPATCYRCIAEDIEPPGDPFGVCLKCSSMMCRTCGNRIPKRARFFCVICFPEIVLLPSAGLGEAESWPPSGPGGPRRPRGGGGGGGMAEAVFIDSTEFETLMQDLAEATRDSRDFFRREVRTVTEYAAAYAKQEAERKAINEITDYSGHLEEEEERREEALQGAQQLIRHVELARAEERLREDLLADAFGVAAWSIGVKPGDRVPAERLALLGDLRLRFIVGYAAPAVASSVVTS
jgi:hypothetical protein